MNNNLGMTMSCEPETTADAFNDATSFDERVRMVRAVLDRMQIDYRNLKRENDERRAENRTLRTKHGELRIEYDRLADEYQRLRERVNA